jgi:hypothetical protein
MLIPSPAPAPPAPAGAAQQPASYSAGDVVTGMPLQEFAQHWQMHSQQANSFMYWWWQMWMANMYSSSAGELSSPAACCMLHAAC